LADLNRKADCHECDQGKKLEATACKLAREAHEGQTYDGTNYFNGHLVHAVERMKQIIKDDHSLEPHRHILIAATWLHDTLEDTKTTFEDLVGEVGPDVAKLVEAVTDEPGDSREEKKAKTYPKIKAAGKLAIAVKLADRLANVHAARRSRKDFLRMYAKEQGDFESALRTPGELDWAWDDLNEQLPKFQIHKRAKNDTGFHIVVTDDYSKYIEWRSHMCPEETIALDNSASIFRVYGMSTDAWRVVELPGADPKIVEQLLAAGYQKLA
jgi:hypothetical protein